MSKNPKVLIIILNWNKKDFVITLLEQIQNLEYKNFQCLVVDNASVDNSVKEIRKHFPKIEVLENEKNLGGTGGYNSGLSYALNNIICDYIWLIDNDAEIDSKTLSELVKVMDSNQDIGIAGSRIIDIKNKEITIELGSFIKWDTIGVKPFLRNKKTKNFEYEYLETDYVAICSALIREEALNKVGLMDERYFIFWDDMDWGLKFKKANYKVVAVPTSRVFHPSFTERKRGISTDYYYGFRNPLLVYSKNTKALLRLKIFHTFFRNYCMFLIILLLNKKWDNVKFSTIAIYDFVFNNWGKCKLNKTEQETKEKINISEVNFQKKRVLVIFDNYSDEGKNILEYIKKNTINTEIHALIDDDRKEIYEEIFDNIIVVDAQKRRKSLFYNFKIFLKILKLNFDFSVGSNANPFGYATKEYFLYEDNEFKKTNIGIFNLYKVAISVILGEMIALIATPIIFISSLKYKKND